MPVSESHLISKTNETIVERQLQIKAKANTRKDFIISKKIRQNIHLQYKISVPVFYPNNQIKHLNRFK